jgi:hypothetical protein
LWAYADADLKDIGLVELACLQCICNHENPNDVGHVVGIVEDYPLVQEFSDNGPWIYQIPQMLTDALAEADTSEISRIRKQWFDTEELQCVKESGHSSQYPEHLDPLDTLRTLAIQANQAGKSLFVWLCL